MPLKDELLDPLPENEKFGWRRFLRQLDAENIKLGLVIDLCNTNRYYDRYELNENSRHPIVHYKLECKGHDDIPSSEVFLEFAAQVKQFLKNASSDLLIGLHCTHGVNRTGFLICKYLILYEGVDPAIAVSNFEQSRGHTFDKTFYVNHLLALNSENRETPPRDAMNLDLSVKKYDRNHEDAIWYANSIRPSYRQESSRGYERRGDPPREEYRDERFRKESNPRYSHAESSRQHNDRDYKSTRISSERRSSHSYQNAHSSRDSSSDFRGPTRRDDYSRPGRLERFPYRGRSDYSRGRGEYSRGRGDFSRGRGDFSRGRSDFARGRGDFSRGRSDFSRGRGDFSRGRGDYSSGRGDFLRGRGDFSERRISRSPPRSSYPEEGYSRKRANESYREPYDYKLSRPQYSSPREELERLPPKRTRDDDSRPLYQPRDTVYERSGFTASRSPKRSPNGSSNRVYNRPSGIPSPLSDRFKESRNKMIPDDYRRPISPAERPRYDDRKARDSSLSPRHQSPSPRYVERRYEYEFKPSKAPAPKVYREEERDGGYRSGYRGGLEKGLGDTATYINREVSPDFVSARRLSERPDYDRDFKRSVAPEYGSVSVRPKTDFKSRSRERDSSMRRDASPIVKERRYETSISEAKLFALRSKIITAPEPLKGRPESRERLETASNSASTSQVAYRTERTASGIEYSFPAEKQQSSREVSRSRTRTRSVASVDGSLEKSRSRAGSDKQSRSPSVASYNQNTGVGFRDTRDNESFVEEERERRRYSPRRSGELDRGRSNSRYSRGGVSRSYSRGDGSHRYSRGGPPRGGRISSYRGVSTRGRYPYNPAVRRARGLVSLSARMRGGRPMDRYSGSRGFTRGGIVSRGRGPPRYRPSGGFRPPARGGFRGRREDNVSNQRYN